MATGSGDLNDESSKVTEDIFAAPLALTPVSSGSAQGVVLLYQSQDDQTAISYQIVTGNGDIEEVGVWKATDF